MPLTPSPLGGTAHDPAAKTAQQIASGGSSGSYSGEAAKPDTGNAVVTIAEAFVAVGLVVAALAALGESKRLYPIGFGIVAVAGLYVLMGHGSVKAGTGIVNGWVKWAGGRLG